MFGGVLIQRVAGFFRGLIYFATLADECCALGDDAAEDVAELVAGEGLVFLNFAIAERPIHFPGDTLPGFGVFEFFLGGGFGFLVRRRSDFVLVDEGADFAAGVFEGIAESGALVVEERDLLGDLVVLGFGGFFGGVNFCEESFVVRGGVH